MRVTWCIWCILGSFNGSSCGEVSSKLDVLALVGSLGA